MKSLGIIIFSLIFARLIKSRMTKMRMPTESAQKKIMMTNITVAQFFLTIVLVVISDPDLFD
jgi:cytochrome b561